MKPRPSIGVQWARPTELLKLYLNSIDNSRSKLCTILNDAEALPKSIVDAQLWVSDTAFDMGHLVAHNNKLVITSKIVQAAHQ